MISFSDKFFNYFELKCILADALMLFCLSLCLSVSLSFIFFQYLLRCHIVRSTPPPRQSEWIFSGDTGYTVTISLYSETYPGEDLGSLFIQSSGGRYQYMTILLGEGGGGGACIGNVPILYHIL